MPTQVAINKGVFKVVESLFKSVYGDKIRFTTKVTGKGQIYIIEKIKKEVGDDRV